MNPSACFVLVPTLKFVSVHLGVWYTVAFDE